MKQMLLILTVVLALPCAHADAADRPLLMQRPTVNRTHIVFVYADQLWRVPREGGRAEQLTSAPGQVSNCLYSPDGTQIALTATHGGNLDVYVMPAEGGT